MNKKTIDYNFGIQKENLFIDKLINKYGMVTTTRQYCEWDFENDTHIFELKGRRCLKETYPSTMIGYSKIKKYKSLGKKIVLCFSFVNKDCYYEYNEDDVLEVRQGGRRDRGKVESSEYLYIPIELLKDF
jgi:hypothetical protein